ncbi:hypothetical protein ABAC460_22835 [Asticcacaulis sp. AC460]|uniref:sensor histidine kinase n=1 Tax=Asticcacaulis sp. AC460 TaxID=1282360 RepID=UPI0003C3E15D|nr:ATP-binding protein [Asticcacaulis sp. AC460]ESQ86667.1 hypothetical protein ABAC460_22835 [Asticcacaulis sp. AC460]
MTWSFPKPDLSPAGLKRLIPVILVIAAVQLAWWAGIKPWLFEFAKPQNHEILNVQAAELSAPTRESLNAATFTPVTLPWESCCDAHYQAIRFEIDLKSVPPDGLGMVSGPAVDNFVTLVNGHIVQGEGRMIAPKASYHGNTRRVYRLPEAALQPGINRIDVIMTRNVIPWFDFNTPYIDPRGYDVMKAVTAERSFVMNEYMLIGGVMTGLVAAAALVLALRARDRSLLLWLGAMAGFYSLKILFYGWEDPPFSPEFRIWYYFAVANLAPAALLCFIDVWTGHGYRYLRWAVSGLCGLILLAFAVAFAINPTTAFDFASDITDLFGISSGLAAVARFAWHLVSRREARSLQLAILLLCMTTVISDRVKEWLLDLADGDFEMVVPLLIVALGLAFLSHNIRLFQSAGDLNAYLAEELKRKEAELAEGYLRQAEMARIATLNEERQRIMRDMHDGIGGQLIALLLSSRKGPVAQDDLSRSLGDMVDELRLMIDSMDSAGDSLTDALAAFRERIEPRLSSAGIELRWRDLSEGATPAYGPQTVLQIFRILQEAVTNVFKHAASRSVEIAIVAVADAAHPVRIDIVDDGQGMKTGRKSGHGLDNMQERARSIGARLSIESTTTGTGVHLHLPAVS